VQEGRQELERVQREAAAVALALSDARLKVGSSQKMAARQEAATAAAERVLQCALLPAGDMTC
jgi:hypothetical protein